MQRKIISVSKALYNYCNHSNKIEKLERLIYNIYIARNLKGMCCHVHINVFTVHDEIDTFSHIYLLLYHVKLIFYDVSTNANSEESSS